MNENLSANKTQTHQTQTFYFSHPFVGILSCKAITHQVEIKQDQPHYIYSQMSAANLTHRGPFGGFWGIVK